MLQHHQRTLFAAAVIAFFAVSKLGANAPYTFNRRQLRFETSAAHLIYPIGITVLYLVLHFKYYTLTLSSNSTRIHVLLIVCRYVLVATACAMHCYNRRRLCDHLNRCRRTLASIAAAGSGATDYVRPLIGAAVSVVASSTLSLCGTFGMFDLKWTGSAPTAAVRAMAMALRLFSYLFQSVTVTTFYVAMRLVRFYFERIVERIDAVMAEAMAVAVGGDADGWTTIARKYEELSERLDVLCDEYGRLVGVCRRYNALVSVQLLQGIGFMFLVVVTQLIIMYDYISDDQEGELELYVYMAAYGLGVLSELYRLGNGCAQTVLASRSAGYALHRASVVSSPDERFRRSVETFSLHVRQNRLEITACGWFTVDRSLIFGLVSAAIAYLVLVVQTSLFDPDYRIYH